MVPDARYGGTRRPELRLTPQPSAASPATDIKIPADEIPAADLCSLGSADNSKIQSVFHVTVNANGETTTAFQTANIHCNG
jgi:hypothetical protein